jgi:LacI family transcriptional regulator
VYSDRLKGYKQAIADNGIEYYKTFIFNDELYEEEGIKTVEKILKMSVLPDGIFTASDVTAATIICKLKQAGINIPGDIAVVGFNDDLVSRVIDPGLTTIHYPGIEMGEIAASTLINKLNNIQSANLSTIVLQHHLIIRQSSLKSEHHLAENAFISETTNNKLLKKLKG